MVWLKTKQHCIGSFAKFDSCLHSTAIVEKVKENASQLGDQACLTATAF